jgi:hypothetical protein
MPMLPPRGAGNLGKKHDDEKLKADHSLQCRMLLLKACY